jgi:Xaa-Pro aminopeptidase
MGNIIKQTVLLLALIIFSPACINTENEKDNKKGESEISSLESGWSGKTFMERRNKLTEKTGEGIIILRSNNGYTGGRHEFRPENNFYYLTGFKLPGSLLVIDKNGLYPYSLFIQEKTIHETVYTGALPGIKEIMDTYLADTVLYYSEFEKIITESVKSGLTIYTDPDDNGLKQYLIKISDNGNIVKQIEDVTSIINEMRVNKDDFEISSTRKAIEITGEAFVNACRTCGPGRYEYETEAIIEYTFRKNGSPMPAFESIVGSGPNSVSLHYSDNNRKMEDGDLLLMDTGAEYDSYCADITRTIPVNGKFSKEQKEIYELVLKSQKAAIDEMTAGKPFLAGHNRSTAIIVQGLYDLGLITDTACSWQKKFYIHYPISHYLGMDVHDAGDYGVTRFIIDQNLVKDTIYGRILEKGMVLTVEPGLYFREEGLLQVNELFGEETTKEELDDFIRKVTPVYEKYKNIGVRIEDDILITDIGNFNLSENIPKEVEEIERIMKSKEQIIK